MKQNNYIRLALLLSDNEANTFESNLRKMITLVLYENFDKNGMTIFEIMQDLKDKYSLNFSELEIESSLSTRIERNGILQICNDEDILKRKYNITPQRYKKINDAVSNLIIDNLAKEFIEFNGCDSIDAKTLSELIIKFLYNVFNSNKEIILSLLGKGNKDIVETLDDNFNDFEKKTINEFIYWDNNVKNKYIYELISCCFDYCVLTVGNDKTDLKNTFFNKCFFLDTNIIFRMMGLDNQSRKELIDSFIQKCKEAGIKIFYTNFTKDELEKTIDYRVNEIQEVLKGNQPISSKAMESMNDSIRIDLYNEFVIWSEKKEHNHNDYNSFKKYLGIKATEILSSFDMKSFETFESNDEEYNKCFESLKSYKLLKYGTVTDDLINVDVNNYLYIKQLNGKVDNQNIVNIPYFIISVDHLFSNWDRKERPGAVPIVVLPSVWYSILLQYSGRTDDDYSSFNRFLNFSYREKEENKDKRKEKILEAVLNLEESKNFKEEIIFDIDKKLKNDYKRINDINEIISKSKESVTDRKIEEAVKAKETELQKNINVQKELLQNEYEDINKKTIDKYNAIMDKLITENTNRRYRLYLFITIVFIAIFILGIYLICKKIYFFSNISDQMLLIEDILKWFVTVFVLPLLCYLYKNKFKCLNRKLIEKDIRDNIYNKQ